jgi:hypothetical protein
LVNPQKLPESGLFPLTQLESDDLLIMINMPFSKRVGATLFLSKGTKEENFINQARYWILTPKSVPLVLVCIG